MSQALPNELLKEILSPPLLVPDKLFADTGATSPFRQATHSSADVLLVCNQWMRVGTPVLYETVVIRSTAQAQALALALKSTPAFGRFIKNLRIEGAFGAHLGKIALVALNVTDFCFSLAIYADANVNGLVKLLSTLDPERVILTTAPPTAVKNKGHTAVLSTLCRCIPKWSRFRTFHYSSSTSLVGRSHSTDYNMYPELAGALARSSSLRAVHFWLPHSESPGTSTLFTLATNVAITRFYVTAPHSLEARHVEHQIPHSMRSRLRIVGQENAGDSNVAHPTASLPNPFFTPLSNVSPATRSAIWSRIISNAILKYADEGAGPHDSWATPWFDKEHYRQKTAKAILLVSRSFFKLAVALLCRHVALDAYHITQQSTFQSYLRQLDIPYSEVQVVKICNWGPRLEVHFTPVCKIDLTTSVLTVIGQASGSTLTHLVIEAPQDLPFDITALSQFTQLETLHFKVQRISQDPKFLLGHLPADALPRLRTITVVNGSVLLAKLAVCRIPRFEELRVAIGTTFSPNDLLPAFLASHGRKVKRLTLSTVATSRNVFNACTRLEALEMLAAFEAPSPEAFEGGHATLQELKIHWAANAHGQAEDNAWRMFFEMFTRDLYPSLREIRFNMYGGKDLWPSSEREMKKSPWPDFASKLAAQGVTILDHNGRAWRPRLSARR
ncbi:hypothetical protein EXIGLDRAFT_735387 [Exidia glandulosa HHB12029]|uniref:Uncharacterized protein n=1 Tax=Exidia glandulosa HHB12029 TaxID=1314781 RepID=A0A165JV74_EXIGL|nr:hypothetical protein EXIGLDRAFT_735387 [Exidia glandulosa HHB12029]